MTKIFCDVSGEHFVKEPDEQGSAVSISRVIEKNKTMLKDGISVCYEEAQNKDKYGHTVMVPVLIRFYKNDIDCGVSYSFDCMTGGFIQYVENDNGHVCVSMDRFSIKKRKSAADAYYKQARDMWNTLCGR